MLRGWWAVLSVWMLSMPLMGAKVVESHWREGQAFVSYLKAREISDTIIYDMNVEDRELLSEIQDGIGFYELYSDEGRLLQSLIPIGEEMQIKVALDEESDVYTFDIIPIHVKRTEHTLVLPITSNPTADVLKATNNKRLANRVGLFFDDMIDCTKLQKGDTLAMIYTQRERLGKLFAMPRIEIAMIETGNKRQFIYADESGDPTPDSCRTVMFDKEGNQISTSELKKLKKAYRFGMPLRHIRITSRFSHKRWHPILKRYRPHLGTDFGAKKGTPLLAVAPGKVIFSGWKGGYGKVVKIRHQGGYISLYAHQSRIRAKVGQRVKKGDIIGYVGNTGRSTGPHLHFGLYKNGRAIDPMRVLKKESTFKALVSKTKEVELEGAKENKARLIAMLENPSRIDHLKEAKSNLMRISQKPQEDGPQE
jgi:murein DD-endopeptidase MepM/ murein hydrolase activator NlpD